MADIHTGLDGSFHRSDAPQPLAAMPSKSWIKLLSFAKWLLLGVWLVYWLYSTRYAMLDDALIHLRYAMYLHNLHRITYDGINTSYGTSSLLYVSLLAILRSLTQSALLPKLVSCTAYVLLILLLLSLGKRFTKNTGPHVIWLGLLFASLSPMAIRWFTDGMETSLVTLAVTLLAIETEKEARKTRLNAWSYLGHVLMGIFLVLLRIELASVALIATAVILLGRLQRAPLQFRLYDWLDSTAFAFGAALAMIGIRLVMGSLLPDTAVAKSGVPSLQPIGMAIHMIGSSFLLGISATVLAALSAFFYLRALHQQPKNRVKYLIWICANASFPLIIFLACLRGQSIQGIRYILWTLFFAVVWNALAWERLRQQRADASSKWTGRIYALYAVLFLCLLPLDWHYAGRAMKGRSHTFLVMRSAGLERYRDTTLVASDIGFIGYFTGGKVCDFSGLVNGRHAAKEGLRERIYGCMAQHPQMMFLNEGQMWRIGQYIPLPGWVTCQQFDFENVAGSDWHFVMVPAAGQADPCRAAGSTPVR